MPFDDTVPEGAARIPLVHRDGTVIDYALVDYEDAEFINQWAWRKVSTASNAYAAREEKHDGRIVQSYLHREIMGLPKWARGGPEVDHINRDGLDNRRCNLRIVTHAQNSQNKGASRSSKSGVRGVYYEPKRAKWRAQVRLNGTLRYREQFKTLEEATLAVIEARRRLLTHTVE